MSFINNTLCMTTGGGFHESVVCHDVRIVTGARKRFYRNLGGIFGASSVVDPLGNATSATRLVPGVRSGMNYGDMTHNRVLGYLNLYLGGCIFNSEVMNLFLSGSYYPVNGTLPLVVWNDAFSSSMFLFVSGFGTEDGAIPLNDNLNLFIQRNYANYLTLSLLGGPQPSESSTLNLYLMGIVGLTGTIPLSLPNVSDVRNNNLLLYTHGW